MREENEITRDCCEQYQPTRKECLSQYEVRIRFLTIGCVISVGCKDIPFATIKEGMKALNEYIENPCETKKVWENRFKNEE